jgi:hypothetical protein
LPHPGECLHHPIADREAARSKDAHSVPVGKELQKRDPVKDGGEARVVRKRPTRRARRNPGRGLALRRDASTKCCRDSAPITARVSLGGRWQMRQEDICG